MCPEFCDYAFPGRKIKRNPAECQEKPGLEYEQRKHVYRVTESTAVCLERGSRQHWWKSNSINRLFRTTQFLCCVWLVVSSGSSEWTGVQFARGRVSALRQVGRGFDASLFGIQGKIGDLDHLMIPWVSIECPWKHKSNPKHQEQSR